MSDVKQLKVEEYNLVDFVMKIQQGIRDGYEVTDQSDDAPMQIGGAFHLIMSESVKPNVVIGKAVFEASLDTTKLQEQLKAGGEIEQMLADSLIIEEETEELHETLTAIGVAIASGIVEDVKIEDLHETSIDFEKDADKWDNKELGADEAFVETIEPPKEPTIDENLPKDEQVALQAKQTTKRGRK